ncbi:MAG: carboxyl transferase domain-containing protein [Vulcanimicrobiota bacterium]
MPRFDSRLSTKDPEYLANCRAMEGLLGELQERLQGVYNGGGKKAQERHLQRGKLLPRERIALLVDPGSCFLELSPLAAFGMYNDESPGASQICGIGTVSGVECVICASDPTVKGGAIYPLTVQKILRAQTIALENRLPTIMLVESAGANLTLQAEFFADGGGRVFANQARMSAAGLPQLALVFGSSTAGGAYMPGMSDYTVMVKDKAKVFLGGPPLVKMATGEEVDDETLGGAHMHSTVSGVSDFLAQDDRDAIRLAREILARYPAGKALAHRRIAARSPHYDPDELLGVIPADPRRQYDIREVIARMADGSEWLEFKPDYGPTLVTLQTYLDGYPLGILANNGVLFSESANKAAHFISLCNQSRTPILYLQNITGFMVGKKYEQGGIVKHGSQMVKAVATSTVPQFTVIVGGSYGAGNYGMCGRAYDPRFLFSWPNSRIAVMGGEQAAGVLALVAEAQSRARGQEPDQAKLETLRQATEARFEAESSPYFATARLWDDGILDPRHTREALAVALSVAHNRDFVSEGMPTQGVFRF